MKRLVITIILLLPITLISKILFAQERGGLISATETVTDTIDIHYTSEWGWHIIHKEAPKRFLKEVLRRTDACLKCHAKDEYKIFDPHKQLNGKREVIGEKCLYCHVEKPVDIQPTGQGWHIIHKEAPKRFLKEVTSRRTNVCSNCHVKAKETAIFKEILIIEDFVILCQGCHGKGYNSLHPANANHLVKPSNKIMTFMKDGKNRFGIILPIGNDGNVTCVTCHNPHEKGIIPVGMIGAEGAGEKHFYRAPQQTCAVCHQDK